MPSFRAFGLDFRTRRMCTALVFAWLELFACDERMPGRGHIEQQMLWSGILCEKKATRKVYPIFCAQTKKVEGTRGTVIEARKKSIIIMISVTASKPTFNIVTSFATI
jgi:hypothetical protein